METASISKEELNELHKRIAILEIKCIALPSERCERCDTRMSDDELYEEIKREDKIQKGYYELYCDGCRDGELTR